jgi:hypothetical protein
MRTHLAKLIGGVFNEQPGNFTLHLFFARLGHDFFHIHAQGFHFGVALAGAAYVG